MKHSIYIIAATLVLSLSACGGSDDETPHIIVVDPVVEIPTFDDPAWKASDINVVTYEKTASAWLALGKELVPDMSPSDRLAIFCGNELRGVAEYNSAAGAWVALIYGNSSDKETLVVKYYNAKKKHLYQSAPLTFSINDTQFGTADNPITIALTVVKTK